MLKKIAILNLKNQFPISLLCKIANIDRSNFYKWFCNYTPNKYDSFHDTLINVFNASDKTYGYRRMHIAMNSYGFNHNEKFVRKRMSLLNLKCEIRQKKLIYKKNNTELSTKRRNFLNQIFYPLQPNRNILC